MDGPIGNSSTTALEVAVSLGAYFAEKAKGPFKNHFITFSSKPEFVEFQGIDIVDKLSRARSAVWKMNTDIKAVFDLLLRTAIKYKCPEDLPKRIYIFSDMEFDYATAFDETSPNTLMEDIALEWEKFGFKLPDLVFWNLDARTPNIPAIGPGFSYVSGFSPVIIKVVLSGKDGVDLMLETLDSYRYMYIN